MEGGGGWYHGQERGRRREEKFALRAKLKMEGGGVRKGDLFSAGETPQLADMDLRD